MSVSLPSIASFHQGAHSVAVVGLGYVGLPLAVAFARHFNVIGFDLNAARVEELSAGTDRTGEVDSEALHASTARFTSDPAALREAGVIIVAVPTPIDEHRNPDLSPVEGASRTVGRHLSRGAVVVYESTVYPGVTEEVCVPILEAESGLRCGADFTVGYSPERINPGDKVHTLETIKKIVSGSDAPTLDLLADLYGTVVRAGIHRAPSIKVAEAAKVIENTQRDLNIALMNELSIIFDRLGIDTLDVLEAAGTKWNFLPFRPGLVGGHCIGVDPYYLTFKAEELGCTPMVAIRGYAIAGFEASLMGYSPYYSSKKLADKLGIDLADVDFFEINEAFASQAYAVMRDLGLDHDKVNIYGGGISLGHPIGATGTILAIKCAYELAVRNPEKKDAMVSMCIGGGQGISMYFTAE